MLILCFAVLLAFAAWAADAKPSAGCGTDLPPGQEPGGFYNATVNERRYVVFVPPEYSAGNPTPLIMSYHGGSRDPENQIALDLLTDPDYNTDKIVVYPEGTSRPNCAEDNSCGKRYWSVDPGIDADDVAFTTSILEELKETYCLDQKRFFATGKSQGGGIAGSTLACDENLSTVFAAFAPVSGAFYTDLTDSGETCEAPYEFEIPCNPGRNDVAMLEFHGQVDDTASYYGEERRNQCLPSIRHWVENWALLDGLSADGVTEPLGDSDTSFIVRFGTGDSYGLVSHVFDRELGHDWPSKTPNSDNGGDVAPFDATPIILGFFDAHPLS